MRRSFQALVTFTPSSPMARQTGSQGRTSETLQPGADAPGPRPHVLIAEDELHIARMLATLLEDAAIRVTVAGDGLEALERIRGDDSISLVILDLLMPGMGGMDVLRETRRRDRALPIIVLTGKGQTDVREEALELGATELFIKPFSPRKLVNRILELCK